MFEFADVHSEHLVIFLHNPAAFFGFAHQFVVGSLLKVKYQGIWAILAFQKLRISTPAFINGGRKNQVYLTIAGIFGGKRPFDGFLLGSQRCCKQQQNESGKGGTKLHGKRFWRVIETVNGPLQRNEGAK
jgi:hypothetical protein